MNSFVIARLGLALLGVLAAVQGLASFPDVAASASLLTAQFNVATGIFVALVPFVLVWVMSYYLLFHNRSLAKFVAAQATEPTNEQPPDVQRVIVGLVGILVIVYALPGLVSSFSLMLTEATRDRELTRFTLAYTAQALIGLVLVLRPDLLLRLWVDRKPVAGDAWPRPK